MSEYYDAYLKIKIPSEEGYIPLSDRVSFNELQSTMFLGNNPCACAAPFISLRFDFNGRMTVCCMNLSHTVGNYPETSLYEAWFGERIQTLRNAMKDFNFDYGCSSCLRQLVAGNGKNTMMYRYNKIAAEHSGVKSEKLVFPIKQIEKRRFPIKLTFQLHNTCNYECIMCSGEYSSSICKNRDGIAPPKNAYGDNFVSEITEFLKYAHEVEFLGGEPFLIPVNFKLMEVIKKVNPNMKVIIITNGSIFNEKVEKILLELPRSEVHLSLDSLDPTTYAYIRRKGNLQTVLDNIEKFRAIKKLNSISMCPMIPNVLEMPKLIKFAEERYLGFSINNVTSNISGESFMYKGLHENGTTVNNNLTPFNEPPINEFRLCTLSKDKKQQIKDELLKHKYEQQNLATVNNFINFLFNYS
jgi:MoaA/NifB/PqqE/SkfB family radical SAM enzyme